MSATVLSIFNFENGTDKIVSLAGTAYGLSEMGYKVLIIDFDQSAETTNYFSSNSKLDIKVKIIDAIKDIDLSLALCNVKVNLDLLPSDRRLKGLGDYLKKMFSTRADEQRKHLGKLIKQLKSDYDYIFIDASTENSLLTANALMASDYLAFVLRTREASVRSIDRFIPEVQKVLETLEYKPKIIGILPMMDSKSSSEERLVIKDAKNFFGNALFKNVIHSADGVESKVSNIKQKKGDKSKKQIIEKTFEQYRLFGEELIERINNAENNKIELFNSEKFKTSINVESNVEKIKKIKKSVLLPSELHYELKKTAAENDMFIQDVIAEAFEYWSQRKRDS